VEHLRRFGLSRDPFSNETVPPVFVEGAAHDSAQKRLVHALSQRRSLTLLLGEPGTGKSLLLRRLLDALEEELFHVSLLVPVRGVASAQWILSRLAQQLEVESPASERGALLGQVYEKLAIVREDGRHAVLLLDEAQVLAQAGVLPELRGLLNLEYEDRRLLSLVLVGPAELDRAVAADASLAGRVEARVQLRPLDANGAARYVAARVRAAQGDPGIFRKEALRALAELSGGVPRALNTLADHALFEAHLAEKDAIELAHVEAAARELGLLGTAGRDGGEAEETVIPVRGPAARTPARANAGGNGAPRERAGDARPGARRAAPHRSAPLPRPEAAQIRALEPAQDDLLGSSDDSFEPRFEAFGSSNDLSGDHDPLDLPQTGPPKEEEEIEDLFVELVDEES
jgi:type II secretory pathway predicted ATPase ExeA